MIWAILSQKSFPKKSYGLFIFFFWTFEPKEKLKQRKFLKKFRKTSGDNSLKIPEKQRRIATTGLPQMSPENSKSPKCEFSGGEIRPKNGGMENM